MKLILLADGEVGSAITRWMLSTYPDDVSTLVARGRNDIDRMARDAGRECVLFDELEPWLAKHEPAEYDLGITAWWPAILSRRVLQLAKAGFINTHPSLLPHNRGKHYNFWAIVEERPFGVSLHRIGDSIDGGDVVSQQALPYDWTDDGESLYRKAQVAMVDLFKGTYPLVREEGLHGRPQSLEEGSFHRASEIDDASRIDLDGLYRGRQLLNVLRARTFQGKPACWFIDGGETFEVRVSIKRRDT